MIGQGDVQPPQNRIATPSLLWSAVHTPALLQGGVSSSLQVAQSAPWLYSLQSSMLLLMKPQKHLHAFQEFKCPMRGGMRKKSFNIPSFYFRLPTLFSFPVSVYYLTRGGCRDVGAGIFGCNRASLRSPSNKHSGKFLTQTASWLQIQDRVQGIQYHLLNLSLGLDLTNYRKTNLSRKVPLNTLILG